MQHVFVYENALGINVLLLWVQFNKTLRVSVVLSIYMISSVSPGIEPKASTSPSVRIISYLGDWELRNALLNTAWRTRSLGCAWLRSVKGGPCQSTGAGKFTVGWHQLRQELLLGRRELDCCKPCKCSCRERQQQIFIWFLLVLKIVQIGICS